MSKKHGPWTILSSDRKYRDGFIDVVVDEVIQPDGQQGQYATVQVKPGVAVLPIDARGDVFLVRQFRYALGEESLEVIQGGLEDGEPPQTTARRELKEEAGINAERWTDLGTVQLDTAVTCCPMHLFVAESLTFEEPDREGSEAMRSVKLSRPEAIEAVLDGRITDVTTGFLILRALRAG